jgi:polyhydroxybutyrate depolymerase
VAQTISGWLTRNGCGGTDTTSAVPDLSDDGTSTLDHHYACPAGKEVELLEVIDGGHTWPQGHASSSTVGLTSMDFSANQAILDFFEAHP